MGNVDERSGLQGCLPINVWKKESHGIHGRRIWIYLMGFLLLVDSMGFLP